MADNATDRLFAAVDRRGGDAYKWNFAHGEGVPDDVIPMWVADMDLRTAPCVVEALRRRVDHGVFGYVNVPDAYYEALTGWFQRHHGLHIDPSLVIYTSGVVPALSAIIKALASPPDGVMVMTPVYNCFFSCIRNNGCRVVEVPLKRVEAPYEALPGQFAPGFTYEMDWEEVERRLDECRLLLLCNPHNPGGRVWRPDELTRLRDLCRHKGVTVVSDEIHCELTLPGVTFTSWGSVALGEGVICNSPSKAFNTAGLQIANIICADQAQRALIDRAINQNEVCDVNPFGVAGLIAAYNEGGEWLGRLREFLYGNYRMLRLYFAQELEAYPVSNLEGTYLAWVDVSEAPMEPADLPLWLERHGVKIGEGAIYGDPRYLRINFACPREQMMRGLNRLGAALRELAL